MGVTTRHPDYTEHLREWETMRDALNDEVKAKGTIYLPMTDGMTHLAKTEKALADAFYASYKHRAVYPLWVKDAVRSMMGLVSRVKPNIVLPARMEGMRTNATADGFSLEQLFLRTVREVLITGRRPMLVDVDDNGLPYIALYTAESAINWKESDQGGRQDLCLVVLQEQRSTATDEFSHESETVYRVLHMDEGRYIAYVANEADGTIDGDIEPRNGRGQNIDYIPVVFCGSTDNAPGVDEVPLLTMAKSAISYYQLDADYRESLHKTAHPQAWVASNNDVKFDTTGPGTLWMLGSDNAKTGYLEITGVGIEATAKAKEEQRNAAMEAGARVMDVGGTESGEARKARQNDQYATLSSIVMTVASAIQQSLEYAAEIIGADPKEVEFTVEPDFLTHVIDPQALAQLNQALLARAISPDTYWAYLQKGVIPERSWSEELDMIESQSPE